MGRPVCRVSNFRSRLELTISGREFCLLTPLAYKGNEQEFTVPAGFSTDLASTPWFMGWLIRGVSEKRDKAAILHDYFYRTHPAGVTREDADRIFLRAMIEDGATLWRAWVMYRAVRWFGGKAWRK